MCKVLLSDIYHVQKFEYYLESNGSATCSQEARSFSGSWWKLGPYITRLEYNLATCSLLDVYCPDVMKFTHLVLTVVNWILDNSRLSPTGNLKSEHVNSNCPIRPTHIANARHDEDRTVLSCLVWRCELSRPDSQTGAFCVRSVSECVGRRSATAGRTLPQNALVRRSIYTA